MCSRWTSLVSLAFGGVESLARNIGTVRALDIYFPTETTRNDLGTRVQNWIVSRIPSNGRVGGRYSPSIHGTVVINLTDSLMYVWRVSVLIAKVLVVFLVEKLFVAGTVGVARTHEEETGMNFVLRCQMDLFLFINTASVIWFVKQFLRKVWGTE